METTEYIVKVNEGELAGTIKVNINGGQFHSFQGVPYAKPPIGNLRFKVHMALYIKIVIYYL